MMAIGVLAFVVALLVSVMIHEAGHFVTAKLFGMKATQFFVGFGPTLWSRQRGETEYGVKAIPAGGFVKIIGMTPLEDVPPEDQPRAFINKPGWQRFIVLVAGSTMHFIIALVLFVMLALGGRLEPATARAGRRGRELRDPSADGNRAPRARPPAPALGKFQAERRHHRGQRQPVVHGSPQLDLADASHAATGPGCTFAAVATSRSDTTRSSSRSRRSRSTAGRRGRHPGRGADGMPPYTGSVSAGSRHRGLQACSGRFVVPAASTPWASCRIEIGQLHKSPSREARGRATAAGRQVTSVFGVARVVGEAFSGRWLLGRRRNRGRRSSRR